MIDALFFVAGVGFGAGMIFLSRHTSTESLKPFMPQRVKSPSYIPQWNAPKREEGAVVMPERGDISNKDLKIDDLLQ